MHKMRKRTWWPYLLILLSCLNLAPGPAIPVLVDAEVPQAPLTAAQTQQLARLRQTPSLSAAAALLADAASGQVLYSHNADVPRPPASTTKIMTALLVLERGTLTETVHVPTHIQVSGTTAGLIPGETLTLEELLYGLLLPSGNDAALVLAQHISGSEEAFVAAMNARATELGLTHTHFANPHGLDAPGHQASAADLLVLTREAFRHPTFARIVATPAYSVRRHMWENRNQLLRQYAGADGVKTGTTAEAGECLIAAATHRGHRLIAVILGSNNRYADATALLDYGFAHYTWVRFDLPPGDFCRMRDGAGAWVPLGMYDVTKAILPRWQRDHVRSFLYLRDTLPTPGSQEPVGILEFTLAGQRWHTQPIFALRREAQ